MGDQHGAHDEVHKYERGPMTLTAADANRDRVGAAALLILAAAALIGCSTAVAPSASIATPEPTSSPSPPPPTGLTVTEAIALRDAGDLGSTQITLKGYWTNRTVMHSCAAPPQPQGEIDVSCNDGEYGITERNEAIVQYTHEYRMMFPTEGPHLTPWMPEDIAQVLLGGLMEFEFPPVPIVVTGHFDDPRAADCNESRQQICRERFVIDQVLAFDPSSVPPATPAPTPTPFPSPAPAALFGPEMCPGDVGYAFVGWTTTDKLNIPFDRPGHVFAMVTKNVIPIGDWIDDPNGSGQKFRGWGQRVCLSEDIYIGQPFNVVPIEYAAVNGTAFKEWEDGRHEPDPP